MSSPTWPTWQDTSLSEACCAIEQNVERNNGIFLTNRGTPAERLCITSRESLFEEELGVSVNLFFDGIGYSIKREEDFADVSAWGRLGRLINSIPTIISLSLRNSLPIDHPSNECLLALYTELKDNKSIEKLDFNPIQDILPMFDLAYFMQNSTNIEVLTLRSEEPLTPEQVITITTSISDVQLKSLQIRFQNDGAFEQIVSACLGVENLILWCVSNSQLVALAALLRNPNAVLQRLELQFGDSVNFDAMLALETQIIASLVGNRQVRELECHCIHFEEDGNGHRVRFLPLAEDQSNCFDTLLCDLSSLENICNSNHTLKMIDITNVVSERATKFLELNKNENKKEVIQNKIFEYYIAGGLDLAPFASMLLSVLAKVMSLGGGMTNKQTAIFKLLRGIPDLCNVSNRTVKFEQSSLDNTPCNKRQKVDN